jgi:hypothetical protein
MSYSKKQKELLSSLCRLKAQAQNTLNGNTNRRVIGNLTKRNNLREYGTANDNRLYNASLDERQRGYLESVGSVLPYYTPSVVSCFKDRKGFNHNPNLTYAFEALKKIADDENKDLIFITSQLSDIESINLYEHDSPASHIRSKVSRKLKTLLNSPVRGFLVLERSPTRMIERMAQNASDSPLQDKVNGLHFHMLLVSEKSNFEGSNKVKVLKALKGLTTGADNATIIKLNYVVKRLDETVDGLRADSMIEIITPIDGSLSDYLSKELGNPISKCGNQNFALMGIREDVKRLWSECHDKQVALNQLVDKISKEIDAEIDTGDMQTRINKVLLG